MKVLNEVQFTTKLVVNEAAVKEPGVLCTVRGTFAEYDKKNLNNRFYSKPCWVKTLDREDIKEALKGKRMFGELDHPDDYLDIKLDKTAFCVTDLHLNEASSTVEGEFKVLDTPAGHILNTLIRFGSVLGVSSRAQGDLDEDNNVIPESYEFVTFDVVTNPSNVGARPVLVESVGNYSDKLYDSLVECVENATNKQQLEIVRKMSLNLSEEMADEIINKVVKKEEEIDSESDDECVTLTELNEKLDRVSANIERLIDMFNEHFSKTPAEIEHSEEELVTDVVESSESKVRKPVINESKNRETTVISVKRIDEDTDGSSTEESRTVELIKVAKSK